MLFSFPSMAYPNSIIFFFFPRAFFRVQHAKLKSFWSCTRRARHAYSRAANIGWEFGVRNARGRPLPAPTYKVTQVPKELWWAGGNSDTFFFPTSKFLPRFCRHIVGVYSFVHHKPLTSNNNNNKNCVRDSYITVRMWWNARVSRSMRESWQPWYSTLARSLHRWHWQSKNLIKDA